VTPATRPVPVDGFRDWYTACEHTFGSEPQDDELAVEASIFEADRSLATFDGDRIVATAGAFSLDLSVPGGSRPAAGVTMVSVAPTHRRRGLATALMHRQLHDLHELGRESFAALWASEPSIYGRFGYGLASWAAVLEIPTRSARLRTVGGLTHVSLRPIDVASLGSAAGAVHEAERGRRAGMLRRDERWWARRVFDPESRRGGATSLRCVVVDGPTGVEGYAMYSMKPDWQIGGPEYSLSVRELIATSPAAEHALWQYLLQHDLVGSLSLRPVAVDSPLLHLLMDPRRAGPRLVDNLWVRLVDVRRALVERTYARDGRVILDVADEICPWNTSRLALDIVDGVASVTTSAEAADISLPVDALGALYLGGTGLMSLAAAGRVAVHRPDRLPVIDSMFRTAIAPFCPEVF
jgi:predicted acetyltransferase